MSKTIPLAATLLIAAASQQAWTHEEAHGTHVHAPHAHGIHTEGMDMSEHWMAPEREAKRRNPARPTRASLRRGETLYRRHCALCHGPEGAGDGPAGAALTPKPANLQAMVGHHGDGDLAWKIAEGRGAMPAWKSRLQPRQIWDLVNYLKRLSGGGR